MAQDMCLDCKNYHRPPDDWEQDDEWYFPCVKCACFNCPHLHSCSGQCSPFHEEQNIGT